MLRTSDAGGSDIQATLGEIVKMKLMNYFMLLLLTIVGIRVGSIAGIYFGITYQELFGICPFRGGIDCISYLWPFPIMGALSGPFLIFAIRVFMKSGKGSSYFSLHHITRYIRLPPKAGRQDSACPSPILPIFKNHDRMWLR